MSWHFYVFIPPVYFYYCICFYCLEKIVKKNKKPKQLVEQAVGREADTFKGTVRGPGYPVIPEVT